MRNVFLSCLEQYEWYESSPVFVQAQRSLVAGNARISLFLPDKTAKHTHISRSFLHCSLVGLFFAWACCQRALRISRVEAGLSILGADCRSTTDFSLSM